jgi:hypothetical protein
MPDIGETLRDARMRQGIDVSEVELSTKIRAKYIRALENEEWGLLPGPTFVKTFLRTYAEFLGLDASLLVEEYKQQFEGYSDFDLVGITPPGRPRERRPARRHRPSRGLILGLVLLGIVALLVVLGSIGADDSKDGQTATVSTPTTPPTTASRPVTTPPPAPRPTTVKLGLAPTADVYVCLRNSAGKLVLSDTVSPGGPSRTYKSRRFRITVGNSEIALVVNGRRVKVRPSAEPVTYSLTPTSTKVIAGNAC